MLCERMCRESGSLSRPGFSSGVVNGDIFHAGSVHDGGHLPRIILTDNLPMSQSFEISQWVSWRDSRRDQRVVAGFAPQGP